MNDPISALTTLLPDHLKGWFAFLLLLSPFAGRIYHALITGGGLSGVVGAIWFGTNRPARPAQFPEASESSGASAARRGAVLLALGALFLAGAVGCAKQNARLEPGGAYTTSTPTTYGTNIVQGDFAFYEVEAAFGAVDSAARLVCKLERDNRATFWQISPEIKHTLDKARPQIVAIEVEYVHARDAYEANPTPAGLTGLQAILAKIQQLLVTVNAAIPPEARTAAAKTAAANAQAAQPPVFSPAPANF